MTGKRFRNSYVPKLNKDMNEPVFSNLCDVYERQDAEEYIGNPKKYLNQTKITNFAMIYAENPRDEKKEKKTAKEIKIEHFKNYRPCDLEPVFRATLRCKSKHINKEAKKHMWNCLDETQCSCVFKM